jgi:hydrogenase expression/formation protein HypC
VCLAIPGQIVAIEDAANHIAKVDVGGVRRKINVGLIDSSEEQTRVGDWVLIHVGFALSRVDEAEAAATLEMLQGMGDAFDDELEQLRASDIG